MRKSEENRPGGGKRVKFDDDAVTSRSDKVVVREEKRKDGVKRVRFDRPPVADGASNDTRKEAKP